MGLSRAHGLRCQYKMPWKCRSFWRWRPKLSCHACSNSFIYCRLYQEGRWITAPPYPPPARRCHWRMARPWRRAGGWPVLLFAHNRWMVGLWSFTWGADTLTPLSQINSDVNELHTDHTPAFPFSFLFSSATPIVALPRGSQAPSREIEREANQPIQSDGRWRWPRRIEAKNRQSRMVHTPTYDTPNF